MKTSLREKSTLKNNLRTQLRHQFLFVILVTRTESNFTIEHFHTKSTIYNWKAKMQMQYDISLEFCPIEQKGH